MAQSEDEDAARARAQRCARELDIDRTVAAVAQYFIDGKEFEAAQVVLGARVEISFDIEYDFDEWFLVAAVQLTGPRFVYEAAKTYDNPLRNRLVEGFRAVLPCYNVNVSAHLEPLQIDPDWRDRLLAIAKGADVTNQGQRIEEKPRFAWNNLYFRSKTERKIAEALDRAGVTFFPNCMGRLTVDGARRNREPDFLVCHRGKWGILEVDGDTFHTTAAVDHERDRAFKVAGIRTIERFQASDCYADSDAIVAKFLQLLVSA